MYRKYSVKGKGKCKGRYSSFWGDPTSELRDVTCHDNCLRFDVFACCI